MSSITTCICDRCKIVTSRLGCEKSKWLMYPSGFKTGSDIRADLCENCYQEFRNFMGCRV